MSRRVPRDVSWFVVRMRFFFAQAPLEECWIRRPPSQQLRRQVVVLSFWRSSAPCTQSKSLICSTNKCVSIVPYNMDYCYLKLGFKVEHMSRKWLHSFDSRHILRLPGYLSFSIQGTTSRPTVRKIRHPKCRQYGGPDSIR